jgi:hypothetical protein
MGFTNSNSGERTSICQSQFWFVAYLSSAKPFVGCHYFLPFLVFIEIVPQLEVVADEHRISHDRLDSAEDQSSLGELMKKEKVLGSD